ncbi:hypothetical protein JCM19235_1621 [Vibrio maritimus]|uniref:Uncharacterized protein n=1 Tax=Vibrio maritimus TaxID=990268 RepID=A0A090S5K2_9VIBR|nr:hypothetical protein JCM19235_1621 [Vibrio maritimus]
MVEAILIFAVIGFGWVFFKFAPVILGLCAAVVLLLLVGVSV